MTHKPPQGIDAGLQEALRQLRMTAKDARYDWSEIMGIKLARLADEIEAAAPPDPRKDLAALEEHVVSWDVVPNSSKMACDGIRVERRDGFEGRRWAIVQHGYVLNKLGDWEYEPQPSSRNEEWLKTVRWDSFAGALKAAEMRGAKR